MKQPIMLVPRLREFHWEDLANVHLDLSYCRHRLIQTVNEKLSSQTIISIEALDQLAKLDELLEAAGANLERAKSILFNLCYDTDPHEAAKEESES